jgi:hypothetical protein
MEHVSLSGRLTTNSESEESEEILIEISKRQRKMSNYSEDDTSMAFNIREQTLDWCEQVLSSLDLTTFQKESIFHRFSTAYDFVMEKLFLKNEPITSNDQMKKMVVTIFFLTYKIEGYQIGKLTINTLVSAFLKSLNINEAKLSDEIFKTEMNIIELIDYNPLILDNNQHQLSFLLLDLLKHKFGYVKLFKENGCIELFEKDLREINKKIQFNEMILFDVLPIDKAAISVLSVIDSWNKDEKLKEMVEIEGEQENLKELFFDYLKQELQVLKMEKEIFSICIEEFNKEKCN